MATRGGKDDVVVESRATRHDAFELARRKYLNAERIDIGRMAEELGVNRVTLYRWVGTKDELLVEIIWSLTEEVLTRAWSDLASVDGPRVPALLGAYLREAASPRGEDGSSPEANDRLMRLLTIGSHGFQPRLVAAVRTYLLEDIADRRISSNLAIDDLAYATVRIAESYYHLPTIAGLPPDPERAERVLSALLQP